jgi:hypothetical protein
MNRRAESVFRKITLLLNTMMKNIILSLSAVHILTLETEMEYRFSYFTHCSEIFFPPSIGKSEQKPYKVVMR